MLLLQIGGALIRRENSGFCTLRDYLLMGEATIVVGSHGKGGNLHAVVVSHLPDNEEWFVVHDSNNDNPVVCSCEQVERFLSKADGRGFVYVVQKR